VAFDVSADIVATVVFNILRPLLVDDLGGLISVYYNTPLLELA